MCTSPEFVASLAFAGMLASMALGLVRETRFVGYIEKHHPSPWNELAKRSKWLLPDDWNYSYAGVQWHLIFRGGYKDIDDARARTGAQCAARVRGRCRVSHHRGPVCHFGPKFSVLTLPRVIAMGPRKMNANLSIDADPQRQEAASPQVLVVRSFLRYLV